MSAIFSSRHDQACRIPEIRKGPEKTPKIHPKQGEMQITGRGESENAHPQLGSGKSDPTVEAPDPRIGRNVREKIGVVVLIIVFYSHQ